MERTSDADFDEEPQPEPGGAAVRVIEIPIFPLEIVLFPYMKLPLHIFEERYKEMVNRCVHESLPFGIVLATSVDEATGVVQTCSVGCTARISRVERLPDGRMNIEVIGEERFHILDTHEQHPYRSALTEVFIDNPVEEAEIRPLAEEVQTLLTDFLLRSLAVMGQHVVEFELPDDPEYLSFIASCVLPVTNDEKQHLLEGQDILLRLTAVQESLLEEVARLRESAATEERRLVWKRLETTAYEGYRCSDN